MKNNNFAFLLIASIAFLFILGCNPDDMKKLDEVFKKEMPKPQRIITINSIVKYPRAKKLEKEITTFSGQKVWVNTNSYLHSKSIEEIELVKKDPEGHFYDLKLKLSKHGKLIWMQISTGFSFQQFGIIIDGLFYRTFKPLPMGIDDDYAILEGPFDKYTAEQVKKYAKTNYEFFNQE